MWVAGLAALPDTIAALTTTPGHDSQSQSISCTGTLVTVHRQVAGTKRNSRDLLLRRFNTPCYLYRGVDGQCDIYSVPLRCVGKRRDQWCSLAFNFFSKKTLTVQLTIVKWPPVVGDKTLSVGWLLFAKVRSRRQWSTGRRLSIAISHTPAYTARSRIWDQCIAWCACLLLRLFS